MVVLRHSDARTPGQLIKALLDDHGWTQRCDARMDLTDEIEWRKNAPNERKKKAS